MDTLQVKKHPNLGILVREDGLIFLRKKNSRNEFEWKKGSYGKGGYLVVTISLNDGRRKHYFVHRLIAETFIPNTEGKATVDHINRVRDDNRLSNLRWATSKEQAENNTRVMNRADYGIRECEDASEYNKCYHQAHRESILERQHNYHKENRERILERKRKYDAEHREEKRLYDKLRNEAKKQLKKGDNYEAKNTCI